MNLTDVYGYLLRETERRLIARCYVALAEVDYDLRAWAAEVAR